LRICNSDFSLNDKRLSLETDWHDLKVQAPADLKDLRRNVKMSRITNE
jgi:hypothetical protein